MKNLKNQASQLKVREGFPLPFGAQICKNGVNFSIFVSPEKNPQLFLNLYELKSKNLIKRIEMPAQTSNVRSLFLENPPFPLAYNYQIGGGAPFLDPYAIKITDTFAIIEEELPFDWEGDKPLNLNFEDLIIYELHIRGFTKNEDSKTLYPGTFLALIEKIPYLKSLGVNAVELMPIQFFDPNEYKSKDPLYKDKLSQYWGYSTLNFFSLATHFGVSPSQIIREFKQLVKELHKASIEVILDVVYNHTAKGSGEDGGFCYKELAENVYYEKEGDGKWVNASGCGNTFNTNHPIVEELIIDSLRYFVTELHVDGFRFDLASIFYRGYIGNILPTPPILEALVKDPIISKTKLISESWDAAGLYQVGNFYPESCRFSEWNGKFRDCIRKFIKGDKGLKGEFATRLLGSKDLFESYGRGPRHSINFITSHDGFSVRDLVSYNEKHNLPNGEENRDGNSDNASWNCGCEGETFDPKIVSLRLRQMKNLHLALFMSFGVPMITMGDDYGMTKNGNNNTWCQDNPLSWFSWSTLEKEKGFFEFNQKLISLRKEHPVLRTNTFLQEEIVEWHGKTPLKPCWEVDDSLIAYRLIDNENQKELYIAFNASAESVTFELPPLLFGALWKVVISSSETPLEIKDNFCEVGPYTSFVAEGAV